MKISSRGTAFSKISAFYIVYVLKGIENEGGKNRKSIKVRQSDA